jgi:hypothetical protein
MDMLANIAGVFIVVFLSVYYNDTNYNYCLKLLPMFTERHLSNTDWAISSNKLFNYSALTNAKVKSPVSNHSFVKRPHIEGILNRSMTIRKPRYYIVYGSQGVGKSTIALHAAEGKPAVVRVNIGYADNVHDIAAKIMFHITGRMESNDMTQMQIAFADYTANTQIMPTIIFDVEIVSGYKSALQVVRSFAKELHEGCHCIIIVSEANAVTQLGKDSRERFIFVD